MTKQQCAFCSSSFKRSDSHRSVFG